MPHPLVLGRHRTAWPCHFKSLPSPTGLRPTPGPDPRHLAAPGAQADLDKLQVLVGQLALGKLVFLGDPRVLQDLLGGEALVRVHVQHLRYQVLRHTDKDVMGRKRRKQRAVPH